MAKKRILHVVTDYPDASGLSNTKAVKNLIDSTDDLAHTIVAIRRVKKPKLDFTSIAGIYRFMVLSLPYGIFHVPLSILYSYLLYLKLKKLDISFDIIHGHKLTIDGIYAYMLSIFFKRPFVLSIRGDTDTKFLANIPHYRWFFKKIFYNAKHVFWVSAWSRQEVRDKLRVLEQSSSLLPNITNRADLSLSSNNKVTKKIVFIGSLDLATKKGLTDLIKAMVSCPDILLDIYGKGRPESEKFLQEMCDKHDVANRVTMLGYLDNVKLVEKLHSYAALVMPSKNETFGMVYVESLLSGVPVICCTKSGIDGYVSNDDYVKLCEFQNVQAISKAVNDIVYTQKIAKESLKNDINLGKLKVFEKDTISNSYINSLP